MKKRLRVPATVIVLLFGAPFMATSTAVDGVRDGGTGDREAYRASAPGELAPREQSEALRSVLSSHGDLTLQQPEPQPPAKVRLGQALFFDRELSGNRDVSCATCHHPRFHTSDGLPLSIGVGGSGLGPERRLGSGRQHIPRNAQDLFNRGAQEWSTMFWDARLFLEGEVESEVESELVSPAGDELPPGLDGPLAAQALFPVTSRDEMRGLVGDIDVNGQPNELALVDDDDRTLIWEALMERLLAIPEYVDLFNKAYPDVSPEQLGIQHAANAIAAFEISAWTFTDSPWDRFLAGDDRALTAEATRGALLFYGSAGCSACHSGPLLTDQRHHNIAVPQLGPGKGVNAPLDLGRFYLSGEDSDRFAFRTPSLRNVALTGPWMHNGAYSTLEGAVRHHLAPLSSLAQYDPGELDPALRKKLWQSDAVRSMVASTLDPALSVPSDMTEREVADLITFLEALTDPAAVDLRGDVPASVPSGLPVD